jgi:hypothetical protein
MGNSMFASFKSSEEYKEHYKEVMSNTLVGYQFQLMVFIERLRSTIIEEQKKEREV